MDHAYLKKIQFDIELLKETHKTLYYLDLSHLTINELAPAGLVFRPLSRREFNFYSEQLQTDTVKTVNAVLSKAVLLPNINEHDWLAGFDEYVFQAIIYYSGFQSEDVLADIVDIERKYSTTIEAAMTMFICRAFSKYVPEDIDEMNLYQIAHLTSLAEQILGKELKYLEYLHPEMVTKEAKGKSYDHLLPKPREFSYKNTNLKDLESSREEVVVTKENAAKQMAKMAEFMNG